MKPLTRVVQDQPTLPCRQVPMEVMFPDERLPNDHPRVEEAKRVCRSGCPIRETCLSDALERREPWGVWGALSSKEREALRRRLLRRAVRYKDATLDFAV